MPGLACGLAVESLVIRIWFEIASLIWSLEADILVERSELGVYLAWPPRRLRLLRSREMNLRAVGLQEV